MDSNEKHGFVVQNSAIPLDLCSSKSFVPITFIASINSYAKDIKRCILQSNEACRLSLTFWEYFDNDREDFENNIFEEYEKRVLQLNSKDHIKNYLKLCKIMCRCSDLEEAVRIFYLFIDVLFRRYNNELNIVVSFLETICMTNEAVSAILTEKDNLKYLEFIFYHLVLAKRLSFLTEFSLVSHYLFLGQYKSVFVSLKYGLKWRYSESVLIDFCKLLNSSWTIDMPLHIEGFNYITLDRFSFVLQTFFVIKDWISNGDKDSLHALHLTWRSIPEPLVTRHEMFTCIANFASTSSSIPPEEIRDICDEFSALFYESHHHHQHIAPRTLQDLCRCSIRNRLSENYQLPSGVSELNAPYLILKYLKLEI